MSMEHWWENIEWGKLKYREKNLFQQWRTQEFCSGGGVQQIQLRTEDRDKGDMGAIAP